MSKIFDYCPRMIDAHPILPEIEAFLAETGMAATTFGQLAAHEWRLVERLRAGGDLRRRTEARIRAFMASHRAQRCPAPVSDVRPAA